MFRPVIAALTIALLPFAATAQESAQTPFAPASEAPTEAPLPPSGIEAPGNEAPLAAPAPQIVAQLRDPLAAIADGTSPLDGALATLAMTEASGGLRCAATPVIAAEANAIAATDAQLAAAEISAATRQSNVAASAGGIAAALGAEDSQVCIDAAMTVSNAMKAGGHLDDAALQTIARAAEQTRVAICASGGAGCDTPAAPQATPEAAPTDEPRASLVAQADEAAGMPQAPAPVGLIAVAHAKIVEFLGPLGPVILLAGVAFLLILSTIPFLLKKTADPMERLERIKNPEPQNKPNAVRLRQKSNKEDKLAKYSNFLEPKNAAEYSAVQMKLMQAGYRGKNAVRMYHFAQFSLGLLLLLVGVAYAIYSSATGEPTTQNLIMSILIPGAVGYMGPKYWVNKRMEKRKEQITNGFPDALDMMLVCVEAGQSLDQSIIRVAREIRSGFPALADEFEMVSWEIKAGKDKINVLRDMSERAGVTDVASFVTVLIQSASFGTSVADALRVYASEMRDKRVMRAEEKANTLPTKMTLATMMLTVPPLLIILLGPSVYNISETLGSMGK